MTEEVKEQAQEEINTSVEPQENEQSQDQAQDQEKAKQSDKEFNFSQMRKQIKERDDYIRNMKSEMDNLKSEFTKLREPQEPPEVELEDDDFVTKKHAENLAIKKYKKLRQQEIEEENQKNFKARAREIYPDFDSIVTTDNLQRLENEMPEIAKIIGESKDNLKMASGAYKAIKTLLKQNTMSKEIENNVKALESNKKEPLAAAAIDRRPIAQAARLTDKDYQELWQEMQHYASKV